VFKDEEREIEIAVTGPFIANDYPTVLGAAVKGVGLAHAPEPTATALIEAGKLSKVLESFATSQPGVFLYYPGRRQALPKLRAFIDHVKARGDVPAGTRTS